MKLQSYICILSLAVSLAACQTSKDYSAEILNNAEEMIKTGNERNAYDLLSSHVLTSTTYGDRARAIYEKNPTFKAKYPEFLRSEIAEAKNPSRLVRLRSIASQSSSRGLISPAQEQELLTLSEQVAVDGNRTGNIPFDYSDEISAFPGLATPEAQSTIFRRSLEKIATASYPSTANIKGVFGRAAIAGPKSQEASMVLAALPGMKLSANEIREYVAAAFPEHARKMLSERSATVKLVIDPEDRLLYEDLATKVRTISSNLTLVTGSEQPTVTVTVKKLQWEERREPERTQPVVYSQGDVNLLAAVMLMPRNASYLYDVTTGGVEVAYAFEIKANGKGMQPYDHLLRDKTNRTWRSCSNARIQNVFGGVQRADFVANDHMAQTCNGGGTPVSADRLRDSVLDDVIRSIKRIPVIERIASTR